jgi:hypothetical protein
MAHGSPAVRFLRTFSEIADDRACDELATVLEASCTAQHPRALPPLRPRGLAFENGPLAVLAAVLHRLHYSQITDGTFASTQVNYAQHTGGILQQLGCDAEAAAARVLRELDTCGDAETPNRRGSLEELRDFCEPGPVAVLCLADDRYVFACMVPTHAECYCLTPDGSEFAAFDSPAKACEWLAKRADGPWAIKEQV